MRSEDEEENDYEDDEDDDEEERDDADKDLFGSDQFDGDGDGDGDGDVEGEADDVEEDEDDEDDGDADADEDDEEEDEDDEDEDEDDDEEGKDDEDEDTTAPPGDSQAATKPTSPAKTASPSEPAQPPHLLRRSLFIPGYTEPPASLTIEAMVGIPLPSAVHCLAASTCLSYLLTGSQDGYVRAYDTWPSVNGAQVMTAQQRGVVGLGEGVNKAGVGRGWWAVEVDGVENGQPMRKSEPVFSLACQGDALWTLAGTQSGPINLYSLRHQPGHLVHSLKGHSSVVSCLQLLPGDTSFLSGSWDGSVREWDLNTGQVSRNYPTHGAQISSIALKPISTMASPAPAVSVHVGADFFKADRENEDDTPAQANGNSTEVDGSKDADGDATMADGDGDVDDAASYDPLFDDDAEGEEEGDVPIAEPTPAPAAPAPVSIPTPTPAAPTSLALPGTTKPSPAAAPSAPNRLFPAASTPTASASRPHVSAAANIPLLSPASYQAFSNDVLLTSSMDGQVTLIDRRSDSPHVGRLQPGDKAPPWCMSATWLGDGNQVLAGRRNGTIDVWDVRKSSSTAPSLLRTFRTPQESGPVSCIVAFPDGRHVATASQDNIRLWNTLETVEYYEAEEGIKRSRSRPPFRIIAGHHGGIVSSMIVDPTSRFLVTASGDRGWQGESTKVVLIHEVKW